jgi:phosphatidate cytidylyltransferase
LATEDSTGHAIAVTEASSPTAKPPSNLAVRLLTAAVGAPAILALLYLGPNWGAFLLVFFAGLIGAWELFGMTHAEDPVSRIIGVILTGAVASCMYWLFENPRVIVTMLIVVPLLGPLLTLARLGDMKTAALRACALSMGPLFVGIPLTLLAIMRRDVSFLTGNRFDGAGYVVLAIMFAWFGDTGGYFAGRFLGKHKLYEAVSPKKTIEGAVGGLAGSSLGAVMAHFWYLPSLPLVTGIALALAAGTLGQLGDLGESLLKRSLGVKDSGAIVPGHGGILDRVDALLMTSSVVFLYTLWMK